MKIPAPWKSNSPALPQCHTGRSVLLSYPNADLGIAGWSRSPLLPVDGAVIDLASHLSTTDVTGRIASAINPSADAAFPAVLAMKVPTVGPSISLPLKDYAAPTFTKDVWDAITSDIDGLLIRGQQVTILCQGGHGRSGTVAAIICYLLSPTLVGPNPIEWVRERHCSEAVESESQIDYVFNILNLPRPTGVKAAKQYTSYIAGSGYNSPWPGYAPQTGLSTYHNDLYDRVINEWLCNF